MNRKQPMSHTPNVPTGVEIRQWQNGHSTLRIQFQYRGVLCREALNLPATPANLKFAAHLRGDILSNITKGTFNYAKYFPHSKNALRFGYKPPSDMTVGEMLINYLEEAKRTLEYSTYDGYYKKKPIAI